MQRFMILFQLHIGKPVPDTDAPVNIISIAIQKNSYRSTVYTSFGPAHLLFLAQSSTNIIYAIIKAKLALY